MGAVADKLASTPPGRRAVVLENVQAELGPLRLPRPYVPHHIRPTPKQEAFLRLNMRELFYGGAAGPGKSTALLMAALQYVTVPGYSAVLLRRTYPELNMPGGLIQRSKEWLMATDARWNQQDHMWTFPSGATLKFGHMQYDDDRFAFQSAEFHFVGFDELTTFSERQYRYMFSRLRRAAGSAIPVRVRAASNPGGLGHEWVKRRLVDPVTRVAPFIPARVDENPYLDTAEYLESLAELPAIDRLRYQHGDWEAEDAGTIFKRSYWQMRQSHPPALLRVRYWDLAATEDVEGDDPDYTAGALWTWHPQHGFHIADLVWGRWNPGTVEQTVIATANADGYDAQVWIEQEPGASGKAMIKHYQRALPGHIVKPGLPKRQGGDKRSRAQLAAVKAEQRSVTVFDQLPHLNEWLDEHAAFPGGLHDDMVDTTSGAVYALTQGQSYGGVSSAAGRKMTA